MKPGPISLSWLALAIALSGCGGGGSGGGSPTAGVTPPPPSASSTCSLRNRQDFAFSAINTSYLYPETLPASPDPAPFASVEAYIDFLTATARSQGRDRFFTFITSIAEENAFNASGASAGFGIRLQTDAAARRSFVVEAFEGAPALAAGIDRGAEILAVGSPGASLRLVSDIIATEGSGGLTTALGPTTAGTTRTLRIADANGTREVSVTKANFNLP